VSTVAGVRLFLIYAPDLISGYTCVGEFAEFKTVVGMQVGPSNRADRCDCLRPSLPE
jgi:hypothetical protein